MASALELASEETEAAPVVPAGVGWAGGEVGGVAVDPSMRVKPWSSFQAGVFVGQSSLSCGGFRRGGQCPPRPPLPPPRACAADHNVPGDGGAKETSD